MRLLSLTVFYSFFFFQAEDGIRDLVRSRGLGDVYKRQTLNSIHYAGNAATGYVPVGETEFARDATFGYRSSCLLYTSDAADERSSVDLGGRRIIKQKKN